MSKKERDKERGVQKQRRGGERDSIPSWAAGDLRVSMQNFALENIIRGLCICISESLPIVGEDFGFLLIILVFGTIAPILLLALCSGFNTVAMRGIELHWHVQVNALTPVIPPA